MEGRRDGGGGGGGVCWIILIATTFLATLAAAQQQLRFVTEPERMYYVSRRTRANVTCEALGATSVNFRCNNERVPVAEQTTYESYDESAGTTRIRVTIQVSRDDVFNQQRALVAAGQRRKDFMCVCDAEDVTTGMRQSSSRGVIRMAFLRKKFQEEPSSQEASLGTQIIFTCVPPPGEPKAEVIWRKDDRRLDVARDDHLVVGADHSLTLRAVREQDAGKYECVAKNDAGRRVSKPATLTITGGPRVEVTTEAPDRGDEGKPVFLEKPPPVIYLKKGETATLTCDIRGSDRMRFRCNGQQVRDNDPKLTNDTDPLMADNLRLHYELTYADVENYINSDNEESYSCECVAWYRKAEGDWGFTTSNSSDIYLAYLRKRFEMGPKDLTVQQGQTATLMCQPPAGVPRPWVYWMFEQGNEWTRLDPRSNPRYKVEEGEGSLVIENVMDSDQGRYRCIAENMAQRRESSVAYLTVSTEPQVFTQDLQSEYYVDNNGEASLMCSVKGATQLTYVCNGDRVDQQRQNLTRELLEDGSSMLLTLTHTVTSEDIFDAPGEVHSCLCQAWFMVDQETWTTSASTTAEIRLPYLDKQFISDPKGSVVSVGDSVELSCQPPDGKPTPKITWYKDREMVDAERDSNLILLDDTRLVIEYVTPKYAGEYYCVANNSAGEILSMSAILRIDEDSIMPSTPEDTTTTTTQPPTTTTATTSAMYTTTPHHHQTTKMMMMTSTTTSSEGAILGGSMPIFTVTPDPKVFVLRNQPAILRCGAMQVTSLEFYCNGARVYADDDDDVMQGVDPTPGLTYLEKSIEVARDEVMDYEGEFTCQCRAYHAEGAFEARDTVLEVAYLKKMFKQEPQDTTVEAGDSLELVCHPPEGNPLPKVEWVKNHYPLQKDGDRMYVTGEGTLVFREVLGEDAGQYTCTAVNMVSTRYSDTITLTVSPPGGPVDLTTPFDMGIPPTLSSTTQEPDMQGGETPASTPEAEGAHPETSPEGQPEEEAYPESTPESEMAAGGDNSQGNMVEVMGPGDMMPVFIAEPESIYYIKQSQPEAIFCKTLNARQITFSCNGHNLPQSRVHYQSNKVEGQKEEEMMASIEVSREEVENHADDDNYDDDDDRFYCQCHAQYKDQAKNLTSTRGYVEVAYLRKEFKAVPEDQTLMEGESVSLYCEAPEGNPTPEIKWKKDDMDVHGDPSSPNYLVFESVSAAHAGTYHCEASNHANTRTSPPATIIVIGRDPGTTREPMVAPKEEAMECVRLLKGCSDHMPQAQQDRAKTCQSLPAYLGCVDNFLAKCTDVIQPESIDSTKMARNMAEKICSGDDQCPELDMCHMRYSDQVMGGTPAESMPVSQICGVIDEFLRCADKAITSCGLPRGDSAATSLVDIATFYQQYCQKVSERQWVDQCDAMADCGVPTEQATYLQRMIKVDLWCPEIHKMVQCTRGVVEECLREENEGELDMLTNWAYLTCPEQPVEEDDGDSQEEPDNGDAENDPVKKTGKSVGEDDGDDDGSGAWTIHASALLTSILSVIFALTACR